MPTKIEKSNDPVAKFDAGEVSSHVDDVCEDLMLVSIRRYACVDEKMKKTYCASKNHCGGVAKPVCRSFCVFAIAQAATTTLIVII